MKKHLKIISSALSILLGVLLIAALPTEREAAIYTDTLRLHILADSDSEEDQAIKLEIRDRLLEKYGAEIRQCTSRENAEAVLGGVIENIERDVDGWLSECGSPDTCEVSLTEEWYTRRVYEGFTLPAGRYASLCVRIGKAEGKNWWCVMFPPLCLDIATEIEPSSSGYTADELELIERGEYSVRFKLLEIISELKEKGS